MFSAWHSRVIVVGEEGTVFGDIAIEGGNVKYIRQNFKNKLAVSCGWMKKIIS